ncbi:MAG: AMP-binding protein [Burkholderiaceae bacterium]
MPPQAAAPAPDLHLECTMGDLLIRAIERGADRTAFVSGDRSISYRAFGQSVSRFVQLFDSLGLRRGDGVACLGGNSVEAFLVGAAGYLTGVRVTNLHPLASLDDHAFIIDDCGAAVLFFDPATHAARVDALRDRLARARPIALGPCAFADDAMAMAARFNARPLQSRAQVDDLSWIIYTGGTTGRPKGVMHTHRTHLSMVMAELSEWEWPDAPVFLAITPISHGAGGCIMPTLLRSGTVVMENGFTPARFFEIVARHRVSATFLVPTMLYKLLDHAAGHDVDARTLQLVLYGAAPMAPARLREALERFGPIFMQLYGQSEAPNCITVLRKRDHVDASDERLSSCGMPIFTSQVALLDDQGRPVPDGETGELCVRGPLVMRGYWQRPEETRQALRDGWLHTGDLARRDRDGYLSIVGRSKDMIISGGFNVYPAEVENVLTAHPSVSAAAVIGLDDPVWGEAVTAVVVRRPGQSVDEHELIALVRDAKGAVSAPKSVIFVDELPVSSLGKPDKKALRQQFGGGR